MAGALRRAKSPVALYVRRALMGRTGARFQRSRSPGISTADPLFVSEIMRMTRPPGPGRIDPLHPLMGPTGAYSLEKAVRVSARGRRVRRRPRDGRARTGD